MAKVYKMAVGEEYDSWYYQEPDGGITPDKNKACKYATEEHKDFIESNRRAGHEIRPVISIRRNGL